MKGLATLTLASLLSLPAVASANDVIGARYQVEEDEVALTVRTSEPVTHLRVRSEPGAVRVWLSGMDDARLDPPADGGAIRWVRIRPGANGTAVVQLRVGDARAVAPQSIRTDHDGTHTTIRIARDALPAVRVETPTPVAELDSDSEVNDEAAADEASDGASDDPEAVEETVEAAAPMAEQEASNEESEATPFGASAPESSGPGMGLLLLVTALLGVAYLVVRIFMGKGRKKTLLSDIDVIASKRLGARHQLVLVRALGEDHLFSIHGKEMQRISSAPAADGEEESAVQGPSVLSKLTAQLSKRAEKRASEMPPPEPDRRSPFGAELLRISDLAAKRQSKPAEKRDASEAVAGLIRLRNRVAQ